MDTGYWFLASIWTISIAFGISSFFAEKSNNKSDSKYMIRMLIFYLLCMVALLGIGLSTGLSFFAIKQTLLCGCVALCGLCKGIYKSSTVFGGTLVRSSFTRTLSQPLSVPESSHNGVRRCGKCAPNFNDYDKLCDYGNFNSIYSNYRYEKQYSSKAIVLYEVISKTVRWTMHWSLRIS